MLPKRVSLVALGIQLEEPAKHDFRRRQIKSRHPQTGGWREGWGALAGQGQRPFRDIDPPTRFDRYIIKGNHDRAVTLRDLVVLPDIDNLEPVTGDRQRVVFRESVAGFDGYRIGLASRIAVGIARLLDVFAIDPDGYGGVVGAAIGQLGRIGKGHIALERTGHLGQRND